MKKNLLLLKPYRMKTVSAEKSPYIFSKQRLTCMLQCCNVHVSILTSFSYCFGSYNVHFEAGSLHHSTFVSRSSRKNPLYTTSTIQEGVMLIKQSYSNICTICAVNLAYFRIDSQYLTAMYIGGFDTFCVSMTDFKIFEQFKISHQVDTSKATSG